MTRNNLPTLGSLVAMATFLVAAGTMAASPAFAHQRQLYTIGGDDYLMVIGSQNEPVFVDDKTGVDLRVVAASKVDPMNVNAFDASPVEGLEKTLKVELLAGSQKKVVALEPVFRDAGHYYAPFYPTIATTYSYRIFGSINNTPVDLTFSCTPTGEAGATADQTAMTVSPGVVRKGIAGGYSCPHSRTDAGFPEPFMANHEVSTALAQMQGDKTDATNSLPLDFGMLGLIVGVVGIGLAAAALAKSGKRAHATIER